MSDDLWDFDQVAMLALHSGEVVGGPLDVMRQPDGSVYGFRFPVGWQDRRVIHVAAVKISVPIPRPYVPK